MEGIKVTALEFPTRDIWRSGKTQNRHLANPAKIQNSLGIDQVSSESSLGVQCAATVCVAKGLSFLHADNVDSNQTGKVLRLI